MTESSSIKQNTEIQTKFLYANFNQDFSCFSVGMENGFKIINSSPFKDNFFRNLNGGIGMIEMLYRSNVLALIGGGQNPKYPNTKLVLWDDHKAREISEIRFNYQIKNVKMKRDKIFVVCEEKIYVFNFNNLENIDVIDTGLNVKGLIAINAHSNTILAYPQKDKPGHIVIKNYEKKTEIKVQAHKTNLQCLSLNNNGTLLATASEKGTLIRIFETETGKLFKELRRGSENALINSINFDKNNKFIVVSSDRKTIHVFIIDYNDKSNEDINKNNTNENNIQINQGRQGNHKSVFGRLSSFFGVGKDYFSSEWSFAQFKINCEKSICAFGPDNTLIIVCADGKYYQVAFDPINGGECSKLQEKSFI